MLVVHPFGVHDLFVCGHQLVQCTGPAHFREQIWEESDDRVCLILVSNFKEG